MEDGHSLFDYNVGLNEIVQLMIRPVPPCENNNYKKEQKMAKSAVNVSNEVVENRHSCNDSKVMFPVQCID